MDVMSVAEMKKEIQQKIEHNEDEKLLQQVLELLSTQQQTVKPIDASKHIDRLFRENDGLLKRLA